MQQHRNLNPDDKTLRRLIEKWLCSSTNEYDSRIRLNYRTKHFEKVKYLLVNLLEVLRFIILSNSMWSLTVNALPTNPQYHYYIYGEYSDLLLLSNCSLKIKELFAATDTAAFVRTFFVEYGQIQAFRCSRQWTFNGFAPLQRNSLIVKIPRKSVMPIP